MKVIVTAAGRGSRWGNFRGTQKHLAIVNNETLIHRTIGQFTPHSNDLVVIARDSFNIPAKVEAPLDGQWNDAAKLWSSNHLWSTTERNIIAFGDVWFSEKAVDTITSNTDPIQFFMRTGPSKITKKPYKEIFAIAFDGGKTGFVRNVLKEVIDENKNGAGAYLLFMKLNNLDQVPYRHHFDDKKSFVEVDDFTDDFDHPIDLIRWEKRFKVRRKIEQ